MSQEMRVSLLTEQLPRQSAICLQINCAANKNDPEKIGIHMLEMLARFRNDGIVELWNENTRSTD